jgi:predicted O-linked N-acetylglucosamine transferase (SPINDLY family)
MNLQTNSLLQDAIQSINKNNLIDAKIILQKILVIEPHNFDALNIIGIISGLESNYVEAINFFKKAQQIRPDNNLINFNLGKAFSESGNDLEAIKYYKIAIKLDKNHLGSWINFGISLHQLKRYDEALSHYDQAIKLKPDYAAAYSNKGNTLKELVRYDEALSHYDQAIKLKPDYVEAYNNKGNTLQNLKRHDESISYYDHAIKLKPDYVEAYLNKGNTLQDLKRYDEALSYYDHAIKLKPDFAQAYHNKGKTLQDLKRYDEALSYYDHAIKLKPDYQYLLGKLLHVKMLMCNWKNFKTYVTSLSLQINENKKSSPCFPVLALIDSSSIQRKSSEILVNDNYPFNSSLGPIFKSGHRDKIKIGYYSSDFNEHPVAYLLAELLELHDKNQFELFGFYFGPTDSSAIHKRVSSSFNQFIDVGLKTDKDIALMSREMGIDIAINLNGFTALARPNIFSFRAAPIQVNYLGYPSTIGAEYMDYIIADRIIIPTESQKYYSEKVVYLPNSYQVNDRKNDIANNIFNKNMFTKKELNLPEKGFVFCCFNNSYKITPSTFDGWMRILKAVKGSVLWLLEDSPVATLNLLKEAEARGLNPDRLVFAKRMNLTEHLARHKVADLFLDTLPYNAHTTASDALWAGLPVLTCKGESFASRVAASLLNAIELPELITTTQEQYETTAIDLANNPEKLKAIKHKLESNRSTTALFDTPLYNKHIQAAYRQMYERYQADLPPNNIYIEN